MSPLRGCVWGELSPVSYAYGYASVVPCGTLKYDINTKVILKSIRNANAHMPGNKSDTILPFQTVFICSWYKQSGVTFQY